MELPICYVDLTFLSKHYGYFVFEMEIWASGYWWSLIFINLWYINIILIFLCLIYTEFIEINNKQ